jgi:sarcosine oxidase subunit beta
VAATAGLEIDLRPTIRQKLVMPELPAVPRDAPMTIDEETAAHWRPALAGAFGLHTDARTPPGEPLDPVPIDHRWAFGLLDPASDHALARIAPFWGDLWNDGASAFSWFLQAGQYEVTPDRRPYLGPAGPQGLFLNTGYSGHGIMAGTAGSRLVADAIAGRPDPAMEAFRADRAPVPREHDIL